MAEALYFAIYKEDRSQKIAELYHTTLEGKPVFNFRVQDTIALFGHTFNDKKWSTIKSVVVSQICRYIKGQTRKVGTKRRKPFRFASSTDLYQHLNHQKIAF
ncbi:hypothetical protein AJ79_00269 [Helicocarpus griseus UAMH5409]|uniref:Uncharacterized protein n=1 Tax=Helicocarpus griseus UAMH5409 TaxID=1447875 RepID=A0A2B7YBD7_9EURO|nr:hypothetical protein AJ79_00269 [Helicocarpus griseus UAMH5409]